MATVSQCQCEHRVSSPRGEVGVGSDRVTVTVNTKDCIPRSGLAGGLMFNMFLIHDMTNKSAS